MAPSNPAAARSRSADGKVRPVSDFDRPVPSGANAAGFGSDVVAETLQSLEIPYIALNPGASYRGFHDSIVNYLGNKQPQMLLCLHEESAVAIAHGYAKVTGKAMAAAVHSNVGLFHATMAIFNAWCDRVPIIIMGATGPVDAAKRRPWIDWIHTSADQGAIVRPYTKWDDQPASAAAARESVLRGAWIADTAPRGPVYINLDAEMQENKLPEPLPPIDTSRFGPPAPTTAPPDQIQKAADLLKSADKIVILAGRMSRSEEAWKARIALAEALHARVVTELKSGAGFPTDHPLHAGAPGTIAPAAEAAEAIRNADVILSLDWIDLAGTLKAALGGKEPKGKVINVTLDHLIHKGWSMDYQGLPPVDIYLASETELAVPALLAALGPNPKPRKPFASTAAVEPKLSTDGKLTVDHMTIHLKRAVGDRPVTLTQLSLSWNGAAWPFHHPLDYLGGNGGGGVGAGPGMSVGSALALKGSGRLPIGVCGDGDFLMGVTALWTAVHYNIPLLLVIANNRSFFNDELHQERVARMRGRPVENRWIGQRISDPDIDLAEMARAQGAVGIGPVTEVSALDKAFADAIAAVDEGKVVVVDVRVEVGYAPITTGAMRGTEKA
jgi:thiamine pyrophosphate-dependent acetolactate synthase large subunit-like protein